MTTPSKPRINRLPANPRRAIADLSRADSRIAHAIKTVGKFSLPQREPTLHMICSSIIGQSISVLAAEKIVSRFSASLGGPRELTPARILDHGEKRVKEFGLTATKAGAICSVAGLWQEERWSPEALLAADDEELEKKLTSIRGIGPWTAKMIFIFGLRRPDVLPFEDLGLREGLRRLHALDERPDVKTTKELAARWAPWRTVGTVYVWQYLMREENMDLSGGSGWW
ncbi:DNA-3-methyladenine glycosylase 2 family protein [Candidatus Poribacteria bacterium]|nr:DNA-3-methyladenine glycosylase 2 family protein [Candidatus Poribacteria bacterium]